VNSRRSFFKTLAVDALETTEESFDFPPDDCAACGKKHNDGSGVCPECTEKYGRHLAKAMVDPFDFAIGLKTGPVMRFTGKNVEVKGDWIELPDPDSVHGLPFPFCRGMQVRFTDIAWVADAPEGS
jgi:hypothetical protein